MGVKESPPSIPWPLEPMHGMAAPAPSIRLSLPAGKEDTDWTDRLHPAKILPRSGLPWTKM